MGIGTSKGAFYNDEGHYSASMWDNRYDDNVITPNQADTNKQLDAAEVSPTGIGMEVSMKVPGNIDLHNRPTVKNEDGSVSTVRSMSIGTDQGEVLIPTVHPEGRIMTDDESIQRYKDTGEHLGIFDTPENATEYAKQLHLDQEKEYLGAPTSSDSPFQPVSGFFSRLSIVNAFKGMLKGSEESVKNLPENFSNSVKHVIDTLSVPGKVFQEGLSPKQEVEKAADLAMLMVGAPAPVAAKMADGTLGSFAGVGSKTVSTKDRFNAAIMEKKGASSEDIWKATGFFKGVDGRWRYEISDEGMKLVDKDWKYGETGKVSDFIEHPELFKAYPELKDINFKVSDKDFEYIGSYNPESKTLTVNPDRIKTGDSGILDVVSHELQHIIQRKEGFVAGSNPTVAYDKAARSLISKMVSERYPEDLLTLYKDIFTNREKFADYIYERAPGEVEANLVMARRQLSDAMRKNFSPMETQKILEGSENSLTGGKFRPPFVYPSPYTSGPGVSAIAGERVGKAALKYGDEIFEGQTHGHAFEKLMSKHPNPNYIKVKDGFTTTKGNFVSREKALDLAESANQLQDKGIRSGGVYGLLSEDLIP